MKGEELDERTRLRRSDRAADETWIRAFLHESAVGVLATVREGQPFVNSNIFVYDEDTEFAAIEHVDVGELTSWVEGHKWTHDNSEWDTEVAR